MNPSSSKTGVRWPVVTAAVVGVAMLVAGGAGHRALTRHLEMAVGTTVIPPGTLARFPLTLGNWTGIDVPLDEAIIKQTAADDLISRLYRKRGSADMVGLFVGAGVRARDLTPHRPEVCYPGAGWTLTATDDVALPLADGTQLNCRILRFSRAGLAMSRITVLNYYVVNGQRWPDVSLLRSQAWRGSKGIRYVAQVHVTCSDRQSLSADLAERSVRTFGAASAETILALLTQADRNAGAGARQVRPREESRD